MKNKAFVYFILIITIINLSSLGAILYQHHKMSFSSFQSKNEQRVFNRVKEDVNLSSNQIKEFQKLRIRFHAKLDSMSVKVQKDNKLLAIEIKKENPDTIIINNLITNLSEIQNKSKYLVIHHFFSIKKILSKNQQEKFFNIVLQRFLGQNQLLSPSSSYIQKKEIPKN